MTKYLLFSLLVLLATSCGDDDGPVIENEEELITELVYTLTPTGSATGRVQLVFNDPDGDGGVAPIQQVTGPLIAGTTYQGTLTITNRSDPSVTIDVADEIRDEAEDHLFFYVPDQGLDVSVSYSDADANGAPLGLETVLTAGEASTGTLELILRHEPDKNAAGIDIETPAGAGGETDIAVTWSVTVRN